jgi:glyoxylase-like metal-dependent hydrolase (beta-lactamase superfamily II)
MLIDTGMPGEPTWDALSGAMAEIGVAPESLRHIVLTHMHPDHCGLAPRLRDLCGAEVWMHAEDVALLKSLTETSEIPDQLETAMQEAGTPASLRAAVGEALRRFAAVLPSMEPDRLLADGVVLDSWVGPLEVIHTPGHTPGHCCLYARERKLLISSDHVIEDITPHAGWLPGRDMLGDYLASLARVERLEVERILPAHGFTFTGLGEWTASTRAVLERRLRSIEEHLADGARTSDDLVRRLWPRDLRPFEYQMALTTVLASREHAARRMRIS